MLMLIDVKTKISKIIIKYNITITSLIKEIKFSDD